MKRAEVHESHRIRQAGRWAVLLLVSLAATAAEKAVTAEPVNRLVFTVKRNSLQPSTITVVEGAYDIELSSGILRGNIAFEIDSPTKAKLATATVKDKRARQSVVVRLTPGTHTIQVVGFATWTSKIVVTAKKN